MTDALTLEWNKREVLKNGTLTLEKSAISLEKVREYGVFLEKVLFRVTHNNEEYSRSLDGVEYQFEICRG